MPGTQIGTKARVTEIRGDSTAIATDSSSLNNVDDELLSVTFSTMCNIQKKYKKNT